MGTGSLISLVSIYLHQKVYYYTFECRSVFIIIIIIIKCARYSESQCTNSDISFMWGFFIFPNRPEDHCKPVSIDCHAIGLNNVDSHKDDTFTQKRNFFKCVCSSVACLSVRLSVILLCVVAKRYILPTTTRCHAIAGTTARCAVHFEV